MTWKGTPAEKRAYAIKKSKQRQAVQKARRILPGYDVSPHDHPCDAYDIDYEVDVPGTVFAAQCQVCGRTWTRTLNRNGFPVLVVTPLTVRMPGGPATSAA